MQYMVANQYILEHSIVNRKAGSGRRLSPVRPGCWRKRIAAQIFFISGIDYIKAVQVETTSPPEHSGLTLYLILSYALHWLLEIQPFAVIFSVSELLYLTQYVSYSIEALNVQGIQQWIGSCTDKRPHSHAPGEFIAFLKT